MALLIFLKQPNTAIAVDGDNKLIEKADLRKVFALKAQTLEGNTIFIATDNIAYVQEISKEKLIKQKKDFENKQQQQQQRGNKILRPNFTIPQGRNQ